MRATIVFVATFFLIANRIAAAEPSYQFEGQYSPSENKPRLSPGDRGYRRTPPIDQPTPDPEGNVYRLEGDWNQSLDLPAFHRILPVNDTHDLLVVGIGRFTFTSLNYDDYVPVREFPLDLTRFHVPEGYFQGKIPLRTTRVIELRGTQRGQVALLIRSREPFSPRSLLHEATIEPIPPRDAKITPLFGREIELLLRPEPTDVNLEEDELGILEALRDAYGERYRLLADLDTGELDSPENRQVLNSYANKNQYYFLWLAMETGKTESNPKLKNDIKWYYPTTKVLNKLGNSLKIGDLIDVRMTDERGVGEVSRTRASSTEMAIYFVTEAGRKLFKYLEMHPDYLDPYLQRNRTGYKTESASPERLKPTGRKVAPHRPFFNFDDSTVFDLPIDYVMLNASFRIPPKKREGCFVKGKQSPEANSAASRCCITLKEEVKNLSGIEIEVEKQISLTPTEPRSVTFNGKIDSTAWVFVSGSETIRSFSCTVPFEDKNGDQIPDHMPFYKVFKAHFENNATLVLSPEKVLKVK